MIQQIACRPREDEVDCQTSVALLDAVLFDLEVTMQTATWRNLRTIVDLGDSVNPYCGVVLFAPH